MKKIIFMSFALVYGILSFGQNETQREAEVRATELVEAQALLQKDTAALRRIWSPGFMVNAPLNMVFIGGQVELVIAGIISYSSFIRNVEHVMVLKDVVVTMGSETVIPAGIDPMAGQTVHRRYTNIWNKEKGIWVLVARHANNICPTESSARSGARSSSEPALIDLKVNTRLNPSHHSFHLDILENYPGSIKIKIIDANGRLIENLEVPKGTKTIGLGENYYAGVYFVFLSDGRHNKIIKLVKL
jgi:hypothetical protein